VLMSRLLLFLLVGYFAFFSMEGAAGELSLGKGDRVVILGNTFAERMQHFGYFEALLHHHFPSEELVVRNMGWSADEVALMPRPFEFGDLEAHLEEAEADVIFLCFGMNESFKGPAGLNIFSRDLNALLDRMAANRFNGESPPRLVLVSPITHEQLGEPWPDAAGHNESLDLYSRKMVEVAEARGLLFIDLFGPTLELMKARDEGSRLTINGIHLNAEGYRQASRLMARSLGLSEAPWEALEGLRKLVVEKNRQFFCAGVR
jgi:hypothetical protein